MPSPPLPATKRDRLKQWLESGEARLQPLTFPQRELWETSPVPVDGVANHICCLIHMRGAITPQDCEAALRGVVGRQEVLRLSILPGKERPLQMIRKSGEPELVFRQLASARANPNLLEEKAAEVFHAPFDLVQGPLYRVEVLQLAPDEHVLVLAIHHAIADGWTLGVFVQDLTGAYLQERMGLREPLPAVPLTYSAWGAAERAYWQPAELSERASFWKSTLAGRRRLWSAGPASGRAHAPRVRWVTALPTELGPAIREVARKHGATLFSTLLAAFQISLGQWVKADDIVVGTPVANRSTQAVRETMGYCAGIVPLRGRIDSRRSFSDTLRAVQHETSECFARAMPFAELAPAVSETPVLGEQPVFEVRFALQNHPIPEISLPALSARLSMRSTGTARFDLGCEITELGDALEVVWLGRADMFAKPALEDLDRLFTAVVTNVCRSPQSLVAALMA